MNKMKKLLSMILITILVLSLGACAKKAEEPATTEEVTATVAEETTEVKEEEVVVEEVAEPHPGDKYAPIDMGGRTITIAYHWDINYSSDDPEPNIAEVSPTDYMIWENLKRVEAKYNVKIDRINIPHDQLAEQLVTSVMAGTPVADIINLPAKVVLSAAINNQIMPLSEFVPENADIFNDKLTLYSPAKLLGENYVMRQKNLPIGALNVGFNADMFKELGLENPLELYEKGQWNWDAFLKAAIAGTRDTDGDGTIDQFGITGWPQYVLNLLVASNGGYYLNSDTGTHGLNDPKTIEAMEFYNQLYNVDKVAKVFNDNIWDWNGNVDAYKDGNSLMWPVFEWMYPTGDSRLTYDYSIAPSPKGPSATQDFAYFADVNGPCVPRGVENPEHVYIIWEELNNWFGNDFSYMEEGTMEWLQSIYLTQKDVDNSITWAEQGIVYDNHGAIDGFPVGGIMQGILMEGKTVAQVIEENSQIAQEKVDAVFK